MDIIFQSKNRCNFPYKFVGKQFRYDTITDALFINENLIVVADRQDATIYLVKIDIKKKTNEIIDTHMCFQNNKYYNPDLMAIINDTIYLSTFSNEIYTIKIEDNKINFSGILTFDKKFEFHGVCKIDENRLYFTDLQFSGIILEYNINNNTSNEIILPKLEKKRIKNVVVINNDYLIALACDRGPNHKPMIYDSFVYLYKKNGESFNYVHGITLDNAHIDSGIYKDNICYVTCQDLSNYGTLYSFSIKNNSFINTKKIQVSTFPHGISYYNNYIAYTSYGKSSVNILNI